jgi:hypothetical protein
VNVIEHGPAVGGLHNEGVAPAPGAGTLHGSALWEHRIGQHWQRLRRMRPITALAHRAAQLLSDRQYLALAHRWYFGRWPDFDAPQTFMEHVQSHMLHCRDPLLRVAADKLAMRAHVTAQIGEHYLVPSLGDWASAQDVPLLQLPRPYVIKPTAASGLLYIVRSGQALDVAGMRRQMARWLRTDYHRLHREWAYQGLKSRLIAETMLEGDDGQPVPDLKDRPRALRPAHTQPLQHRLATAAGAPFPAQPCARPASGVSGRAAAGGAQPGRAV